MNQSERIHPQADKLEAVAAVRARHRDGHAATHVLAAGGALVRARDRSRAVRAHPGRGSHLVPRRERPALPGGRALRAPAERAAHRLDRGRAHPLHVSRLAVRRHRAMHARRKAIPARPTSGSPAIRCTNMPAPSSPTWAKARRRNSSCARTCSNARTACCSRARRSGPATGSSSSRTRSMPPMSASSITGAGRKVRPARRRHPQARICRDRRRHPSDRDALEEQRAG